MLDEDVLCIMHVTRFKVKVKVTRPSELEILPFSKSISSAVCNGSWQMTGDSETRGLYLNFWGPDF